jgi:hypothetical protein
VAKKSVEPPDCELVASLGTAQELMASVIDAWDKLDEAGLKPASEKYAILEEDRATVIRNVKASWIVKADLGHLHFPWRDDTIILAWVTYRKSSPPARAAFRAWAGVA